MYVGTHAAKDPGRAAVVHIPRDGGPATTVTYADLDASSNRFAHYCRSLGLGVGDHVAVLAENHPRYLEPCWGADRSGLFLTPVNHHLTAEEAEYIVADSGAVVLVVSPGLEPLARSIAPNCPALQRILVLDGGGEDDYDAVVGVFPTTPVADEEVGQPMFYSSGTTGKPKGVVRPLTGAKPTDEHPFEPMLGGLYGITEESVYLSPGSPMYHAAPLGFLMAVHRIGGTVVVMERFDPEASLAVIQEYAVTHAQFVPTMFVRMLKLPAEARERYDLSSLRCVIHAAAPCPVPVKQQIIDWVGPIVYEYYGGTEVNGLTFVTSPEWLERPGTVGRTILGEVRILDDDFQPVPTGEVGGVYFANGNDFSYHNDPEKTAAANDGHGATTIGDVGYVDEEGYLFLTDRKSYMIIAGGVNIYPQEIEDVLITHPKVADVAVFGVPDDDMGEQVKAVVQPVPSSMDEDPVALQAELIAFCQEHLAKYKCPRSVDFEAELPRTDAGKLYKRRLKERYWSKTP